jgi:hypothetical protein
MTKLNEREFTPEVGMALATRNGQKVGNGFVVGEDVETYHGNEVVTVYHVLSDFGNQFTLTKGEVNELYEVASWWLIQKENSDSLYRHYLTGYNDPIRRIHEQMALLQEALIYLEGKA